MVTPLDFHNTASLKVNVPKTDSADGESTRSSDAYRHFTRIENSNRKTTQWKLQAAAPPVPFKPAPSWFLISPPASGVDGCYKNGGGASRVNYWDKCACGSLRGVIKQRRHRKVMISRPDENSLARIQPLSDGGRDKGPRLKTIVWRVFGNGRQRFWLTRYRSQNPMRPKQHFSPLDRNTKKKSEFKENTISKKQDTKNTRLFFVHIEINFPLDFSHLLQEGREKDL